MRNEKEKNEKFGHGGQGRLLAGSLIIITGTGLLLQNIFPWFSFNYVWPLLIIAVGLFLIARKPK